MTDTTQVEQIEDAVIVQEETVEDTEEVALPLAYCGRLLEGMEEHEFTNLVDISNDKDTLLKFAKDSLTINLYMSLTRYFENVGQTPFEGFLLENFLDEAKTRENVLPYLAANKFEFKQLSIVRGDKVDLQYETSISQNFAGLATELKVTSDNLSNFVLTCLIVMFTHRTPRIEAIVKTALDQVTAAKQLGSYEKMQEAVQEYHNEIEKIKAQAEQAEEAERTATVH